MWKRRFERRKKFKLLRKLSSYSVTCYPIDVFQVTCGLMNLESGYLKMPKAKVKRRRQHCLRSPEPGSLQAEGDETKSTPNRTASSRRPSGSRPSWSLQPVPERASFSHGFSPPSSLGWEVGKSPDNSNSPAFSNVPTELCAQSPQGIKEGWGRAEKQDLVDG